MRRTILLIFATSSLILAIVPGAAAEGLTGTTCNNLVGNAACMVEGVCRTFWPTLLGDNSACKPQPCWLLDCPDRSEGGPPVA